MKGWIIRITYEIYDLMVGRKVLKVDKADH